MPRNNHHKFDQLFMHMVGVVICLSFLIVVVSSVLLDIKSNVFIRTSTMVETLMVALASYYYGASKGGRDALKNLTDTKNPTDEI